MIISKAEYVSLMKIKSKLETIKDYGFSHPKFDAEMALKELRKLTMTDQDGLEYKDTESPIYSSTAESCLMAEHNHKGDCL